MERTMTLIVFTVVILVVYLPNLWAIRRLNQKSTDVPEEIRKYFSLKFNSLTFRPIVVNFIITVIYFVIWFYYYAAWYDGPWYQNLSRRNSAVVLVYAPSLFLSVIWALGDKLKALKIIAAMAALIVLVIHIYIGLNDRPYLIDPKSGFEIYEFLILLIYPVILSFAAIIYGLGRVLSAIWKRLD